MKKTELQKIIREELVKELGYGGGDSAGEFGPMYSPIKVKQDLAKMISKTFKESAKIYAPESTSLEQLRMSLLKELIPELIKYFETEFK